MKKFTGLVGFTPMQQEETRVDPTVKLGTTPVPEVGIRKISARSLRAW